MFLPIIIVVTALLLGSSWAGVPLDEFYPFGAGNGDTFLAKGFYQVAGPIQLTTPFPFFNDTHGAVYIQTDGVISFRLGISWYRSRNCKTADSRGLPYISPFWSLVETRYAGKVSYREARGRLVLQKAERDVRAGFPTSFIPSLKYALVVTWDRVPGLGTSHWFCSAQAKERRNTFQAVLATDGSSSWAIFYYNELRWTSSRTGLDCSGLGGSHPPKAGYDAGDGQTFQYLPGSCTDDVLQLASTSNMGYDGKWILRVGSPLATQERSDKVTSSSSSSPTSVSQESKAVLKGCCRPLASIPNGEVKVLGRRVSDLAHFSCTTGYVLQGKDTMVCGLTEGSNKPTWLGNIPTCSPECPPLASIPNGLVKVTDLLCGRGGNGNLSWVGPVPACSLLPPPQTVICDGPAHECLQPDFPDGSCVTYVSMGCWVQLYCDEWVPSSRTNRELLETITWKYEEELIADTSRDSADGGLLLTNVSLTNTGTYECQREYTYASTRLPFRSPPTVHRIHVVPVGLLKSATDRKLLGKITALQEDVLHLQRTATRLNSTILKKCQDLAPVEPVSRQLSEALSQQEPPSGSVTAAGRKDVKERIRDLYEGVEELQGIVHKLNWSLRQCAMMRQYRKRMQEGSSA